MFKRVEKRRRRKEEEAETSLNEELKEIMGFNDTDSDESTSESDSSDEEGEFAQDDEGDDEGDPKISVSQALLDPIFVVSLFPEVKACMVCPGKQLKGEKMVELHRISNACMLFPMSDGSLFRLPSWVEIRHMQDGSGASKTMLQTLSLLTMLWRFSRVRLM